MSIRQGKKLIASSTTNGFNLFDCKWADHILNNISWLRADTFSWQSGDVYKAAYEHLLNEFDVTKPIEAETFGGVTVYFRTSLDGHKIVLADGEQDVINMYNTTGVAWYYILDRENKQFKLPRTKFGFTGIRNGVGGYVAPGLPNITGEVEVYWETSTTPSGAFYKTSNNNSERNNESGNPNLGFDASRSNSIYGNSDTVQPPATQMYLYFYVGNYIEDLATIDAGKLTEIVNDFDIDTFKPEVDEVKNEAIVDINDAKTGAIDSISNLVTDLGTSLKYGNVGDIFYTSRLDVSLNGAVECNGNLYNTTDFGGAQSIGNLLRDSKVPYISLSEHQTTVNTYGSCRCFGWDGGTEFRVPKLSNVFIEAGIAATAGEFITAGLPNITGQVGQIDFSGSRSFSGAFVNVDSPGGDTGATHSGGTRTTVGFNASQSNSIYGNSTTVQPPAVRYRAMVQLAFGATDDAVVTAGNVLTDISALNAHRVIAFQAPTSANGYTWYRKYADGWVEQGGSYEMTIGTANVQFYISLPVAMANVRYSASVNVHGGWATDNVAQLENCTTTVLAGYAKSSNSSTKYILWQVSGMAA